MKKVLSTFVFLALVAAFTYAGWVLLKQYEARKSQEKVVLLDVPTNMANLHRQALDGALELMTPEAIGMNLINAGFPPKRPNMDLMPRARLVGTALVKVDRFTVAQSLYQVDTTSDRKFSLFTIPRDSDFDPRTMPEMKMMQWSLRSQVVDNLNVILWRNGNWYVVIVTDLVGQEMSGLLEFVLKKEWAFH